MENSGEIKESLQNIYRAMSEGDVKDFERFVSKEIGALVIGTDPREWWSGYEVINRFISQQIMEMGGTMQIVGSNMDAFSEGTVGWFADQAAIVLNDGTRIPFRTSGVFHREGDTWKLVQWHSSVGSANEEVLGKELTI